MPFFKKKDDKPSDHVEFLTLPEGFNRKKPIYINDENIHQYIFKPCCHPIPGDDVWDISTPRTA